MVENALDADLDLPQALRDFHEADAALRACAQQLADQAPLDAAPWDVLAEARRARAAAINALGPAMAQWLNAGNTLSLQDPKPPEPLAVVEEEPEAVEVTPPPPEAPPAPQPPVVTDFSALKAHLQGGGYFSTEARLPECKAPSEELARLGAPTGLADAHAAYAELQALQALVKDARTWRVYSLDDRTALMSAIAARARVLMVANREWLDEALSEADIHSLIQLLSREIHHGNFNYIKGLRMDSAAPSDGWLAEAGRRWRSLVRCCGPGDGPWREALVQTFQGAFDEGLEEGCLVAWVQMLATLGADLNSEEMRQRLMPYIDVFESHGALKTWRRQLRTAREAEEARVSAEDSVTLLQTAPPEILSRTRGLRAVIVGGDRRGDAQARLQAFFAFESLEWETGLRLRRVSALAVRAQEGHIDMVIFLRRFISHKVTSILQPALKQSGTETIWVAHGYGVSSVLQEVRRYLSEAPPSAD